MRNCSFNLLGINSDTCACEKKNEYMVSNVPFFIKWAPKTVTMAHISCTEICN